MLKYSAIEKHAIKYSGRSLIIFGNVCEMFVALQHLMKCSGSSGFCDAHILYRRTRFWYEVCLWSLDSQILWVLESNWRFFVHHCISDISVWNEIRWWIASNTCSCVTGNQPYNVAWFLAGKPHLYRLHVSFPLDYQMKMPHCIMTSPHSISAPRSQYRVLYCNMYTCMVGDSLWNTVQL